MANKVIIRMLENSVTLEDLEERTGTPAPALKRYLLSGDGQRTPEEVARGISKALGARFSSLFVEYESGIYPRLRK